MNTGAVQQILFPLDAQEDILWQRCPRYQTLDDTGRRLVIAYIQLTREDPEFTRKQWIAGAGLAHSTGYEYLNANGIAVHEAIVEALQVCGKRAATRGGLALFLAGALVYKSLCEGRPTRNLTAVEKDIMIHCGQAAGIIARTGILARGEFTGADGSRGTFSAATGDTDQLAGELGAVLAQLHEGQRRTPAGAAPQARPESVRPELQAPTTAAPGTASAPGSSPDSAGMEATPAISAQTAVGGPAGQVPGKHPEDGE